MPQLEESHSSCSSLVSDRSSQASREARSLLHTIAALRIGSAWYGKSGSSSVKTMAGGRTMRCQHHRSLDSHRDTAGESPGKAIRRSANRAQLCGQDKACAATGFWWTTTSCPELLPACSTCRHDAAWPCPNRSSRLPDGRVAPNHCNGEAVPGDHESLSLLSKYPAETKRDFDSLTAPSPDLGPEGTRSGQQSARSPRGAETVYQYRQER